MRILCSYAKALNNNKYFIRTYHEKSLICKVNKQTEINKNKQNKKGIISIFNCVMNFNITVY